MKISSKQLVFAMVLVSLMVSQSYAQDTRPNWRQEVQDSHIRGNVPEASKFAECLQCDLETYFSEKMGSQVKVEYKLLRKGATQSGVALPKYYLWVRVFDEEHKLLNEGAVRAAAIETSHFAVLQFLDKASLQSNPQDAKRVFPAALIPAITELANTE